MPLVTLETERLLLRPLAASDSAPFAALGADPAVMRYIGSGAIQTPAEAQAWLEQLLAQAEAGSPGVPDLPGWFVVMVKSPATSAPSSWAGLVALKPLAPQHAHAVGIASAIEVGYRLAPAFGGQGYSTEAARALVRHGFSQLSLPHITAIADTRNRASNRVLEKIGLIHRKTYALDGRTIQFHSLSRAEFQALPAK